MHLFFVEVVSAVSFIVAFLISIVCLQQTTHEESKPKEHTGTLQKRGAALSRYMELPSNHACETDCAQQKSGTETPTSNEAGPPSEAHTQVDSPCPR